VKKSHSDEEAKTLDGEGRGKGESRREAKIIARGNREKRGGTGAAERRSSRGKSVIS